MYLNYDGKKQHQFKLMHLSYTLYIYIRISKILIIGKYCHESIMMEVYHTVKNMFTLSNQHPQSTYNTATIIMMNH